MRVGPPNHVYIPTQEEIPSGLCECGCGEKTPIATYTLRRLRCFAGHPKPFARGHHLHSGNSKPRRTNDAIVLSVAEAAYIAAMIDGEGTISVRGERNVRVTVANTDPELMAWMEGFGGTVTSTGRPIATRRECFRWGVSNRHDVRWLLSQVEPYMIVKRQKAIDALALIDDLVAVHG